MLCSLGSVDILSCCLTTKRDRNFGLLNHRREVSKDVQSGVRVTSPSFRRRCDISTVGAIAETVVFDRVALAVLLSRRFCPPVAPMAQHGGPELIHEHEHRHGAALFAERLQSADDRPDHLQTRPHRAKGPVAVADDDAPLLLVYDVRLLGVDRSMASWTSSSDANDR